MRALERGLVIPAQMNGVLQTMHAFLQPWRNPSARNTLIRATGPTPLPSSFPRRNHTSEGANTSQKQTVPRIELSNSSSTSMCGFIIIKIEGLLCFQFWCCASSSQESTKRVSYFSECWHAKLLGEWTPCGAQPRRAAVNTSAAVASARVDAPTTTGPPSVDGAAVAAATDASP